MEEEELSNLPDLIEKNRNRVLLMLYNIFKGVAGKKNSQVVTLVTSIESKIYRQQNFDYMKLARERVLLLKSKSLPELKFDIANEVISVEDFVSKESSEFESLEVKEKIKEIENWAMDSMQSDFYKKNLKMVDGEFQCFKCKSKKIFSMQRQMRGADEPMTTFCECSECGTRWKMN